MTAIFYPDDECVSLNGRFILEARSPHNGEIPHQNGVPSTENEFAFKYREHQSDFRYRLIDTNLREEISGVTSQRIVWERWQEEHEDSPHELIVSDDGWSIIRTHGFSPEILVVTPRGEVNLRIVVSGEDSEHSTSGTQSLPRNHFAWNLKHLHFTTAGHYWSAHSHRYFMSHNGISYFIVRPWWGDSLVIDLENAIVIGESEQQSLGLSVVMQDTEGHWALCHLQELRNRHAEIEAYLVTRDTNDIQNGILSRLLSQTVSAIHLVGVHCVQESVSLLRWIGELDYPSYYTGSTAMEDDWYLEAQTFRPIVHHTLRMLGEVPDGYPAFNFFKYDGEDDDDEIWTEEEEDEKKLYYPLPTDLRYRREQIDLITKACRPTDVLSLVGAPDHVHRKYRPYGGAERWVETWDYDFLSVDQWTTIRIIWVEEKGQGCIDKIEAGPSEWCFNLTRLTEILNH